MNWKALIVCALLLVPVFTARANPMTYKELAMLLRNGEEQRSIIEETGRRKLLAPLTPREEADLRSLGARPALMRALAEPSMLAAPETVAAYEAGLAEQQRVARQQQKDAELRAQQAASAPSPTPSASPAANESGPKPLDLKFVAVDGTPVDIANLRGKVVLIDFWASWCGPAMMDIPSVTAAYEKYHSQGLVIVGISLDMDKQAMLKVTQSAGMPWPEYFDGKGWKNEISLACNIHTLPVIWLVNKQGVLITKDARGHLEADIEKLLGE